MAGKARAAKFMPWEHAKATRTAAPARWENADVTSEDNKATRFVLSAGVQF
jgi:hypothetical protein